jgi:hypothetical protein
MSSCTRKNFRALYRIERMPFRYQKAVNLAMLVLHMVGKYEIFEFSPDSTIAISSSIKIGP